MKGQRHERRALVVALVGALLIAGCTPKTATSLSGRDEAERDVSQGTLKLYLYGEPTAAHSQFAELFAQQCRGTVEQLGAVILSGEEDQRIQDYNRYALQQVALRCGTKTVITLCERSGLTMEHILHKQGSPPGRE